MSFASFEQREYAERVAFVAQQWLGPLPPDLARRDNLPDRLSGFVHSMLVEHEGAGGLEPHKLARRGGDGDDLTDLGLCGAWSTGRWPDNTEAWRLLNELTDAVEQAQNVSPDATTAMRYLAITFATIVERDYDLIPLNLDPDRDDIDDAGPNIASGLSAAVAAAWVRETEGSR